MSHLAELAPGLRRIRAENPSPMTGDGTNTYILGNRQLCVIDPGPEDPGHLENLLHAIGPEQVACILVTHSHKDHSMLAPALSHATGAPVLAYGDSLAGRSETMSALAARGMVGGGEGVDISFAPDRCLEEGATVDFGDGQITAHWTPGHMGNHMCFQWNGIVFTGDHVMGWAPSLVSPPDGDMSAYMRSLHKLAALDAGILHAGHGAPIPEPASRIAELIDHRRKRENAILAELQSGPATIDALTTRIYTDLRPGLHKAAARNVFAHLVDLESRALVECRDMLRTQAIFRLSART
ncbi:MAG: MBL fold metallo-hydrolase [Alphaproteobacteria bacterium]|nr:MBL fold metallo-hydrolase [Alphaproteobacteria bacterium]